MDDCRPAPEVPEIIQHRAGDLMSVPFLFCNFQTDSASVTFSVTVASVRQLGVKRLCGAVIQVVLMNFCHRQLSSRRLIEVGNSVLEKKNFILSSSCGSPSFIIYFRVSWNAQSGRMYHGDFY